MGKNAFLMILTLNILFVLTGSNLRKMTNHSFRNYISFLEAQRAKYITASGVNYALGRLSIDREWKPGNNGVNMNNGRGAGYLGWNVEHITQGSIKTVRLRACGFSGAAVESTDVLLTLGRFSDYAFYSEIENNINWTTGDTCWGPLHTQQRLSIIGSPVFMGRVTTRNGILNNGGSNYNPQFRGGYQTGVDIKLPTNFNPLQTEASANGKVYTNKDIYMEFRTDGRVVVREGSWTATPLIRTINELAPNGIILVQGGDIRIKGVVSGKVTIAATGSSGSAKGNVYIDSSVVYENNPEQNPNSTDMLGIVAENNVIITNNTNNRNSSRGVTVHASIMSRNGGLTAEDFRTRGYCGQLTILGGIQQKNREPVGIVSGGVITNGFNKNYKFDQRMLTDHPPGYPQIDQYKVLRWYNRVITNNINLWEEFR